MATSVLVYLDSPENKTWLGDRASVVGIAIFGAILLLGLVAVAIDLFVRNKEITTVSAVYFGLLMGLLLGALFAAALEPFVRDVLPPTLVQQLRLMIVLVCCYVSVSTLYQTKDEFRFIIPYVEFSKQVKGGRPLVLDTSVIIDGRIADICDTRIIDTKLVVPRFVLQELQAIADSSDKLKRNRGRRGLDMLKRMQNNAKIEMQMHEGNLPELRELTKVDERLVGLAKALGARVVTNDFNLNKIAQLQGVEVINLNELANALKSVALPGEALSVRLVKVGDQIGQGVGYLEDGTMVVGPPGQPGGGRPRRQGQAAGRDFLVTAAGEGGERCEEQSVDRGRCDGPGLGSPAGGADPQPAGRIGHRLGGAPAGGPPRVPGQPGAAAGPLPGDGRRRAGALGRGGVAPAPPHLQAGLPPGAGRAAAHLAGRLQRPRGQRLVPPGHDLQGQGLGHRLR
jgi:uncharacterized protein YacL